MLFSKISNKRLNSVASARDSQLLTGECSIHSAFRSSTIKVFECARIGQLKMNYAIARIKRDLMEVITDKTMTMIHVVPHESDLMQMHAVIEGPVKTPFEGGFYYFMVLFPNDYPSSPPTVQLQTTEPGNLHLYPNQYPDGRVCLSILHTWDGPRWTPALSLKSVLLSVQSLMVEEPYYPATFKVKTDERKNKESQEFDKKVRYETLRLAVFALLEKADTLPQPLMEWLVERFKRNFKKYVELVENVKAPVLLRDGYYEKSPEQQKLEKRLMSLKEKFGITDDENTSSSESDESTQSDPPIAEQNGNAEDLLDNIDFSFISPDEDDEDNLYESDSDETEK